MSFKYIKVKTKGQIEGEILLVPKLRFKEFKDKYMITNINNIAVITMGQSPNSVNYTSDRSDIILIQGNADLNNGKIQPRLYTTKITKMCEINDIIMTVRAPVGDLAITEYKACIGRGVCSIKGSKYLYYYLENFKYKGEWKKLSKGSTIDSITSNDLKNINVTLPDETEQEKISNFLSLLDKKIELQKKKIKTLKIYKKGLSKKLFDKKSNLFFKDCFFHFGGTALEEYVTENAKYRFISIGNYSSDGTYIDNGQRINNTGKAKDKILNKNDLVMVLNDKTSQGNIIGSTILIDEDNKYIYNQRSERIKCNSNIIPKYAWCILNSTNIRNIILKKSQGGTQIYINFHEIEKLKLYVPSIKEQIKLSNIYYSIVSKLNIEDQKLNNLNTLKKSLLQQMFI